MTSRSDFILSSFLLAFFTLAMGCKHKANESGVASRNAEPGLRPSGFKFTPCSVSDSQFAQLMAPYFNSDLYRTRSQKPVEGLRPTAGPVDELNKNGLFPPCDTKTLEFLSQRIQTSKWTTGAGFDVVPLPSGGTFSLDGAQKIACRVSNMATGETIIDYLTQGQLDRMDGKHGRKLAVPLDGDSFCLGGPV